MNEVIFYYVLSCIAFFVAYDGFVRAHRQNFDFTINDLLDALAIAVLIALIWPLLILIIIIGGFLFVLSKAWNNIASIILMKKSKETKRQEVEG
jgi:small-conductance mechanosensitive channel